MKQIFIFLLLLSTFTNAQNYKGVDVIVNSYPNFSNAKDLADKIKKDFTSENDMVRAGFYWISKNIRYNLEEYYNPTRKGYSFSYFTEEEKQQKLQKIKDDLVANTFKFKKGICEEYAQSLKKIYDLLEIESEVIKGNVRNNVSEIGKIKFSTNHAWNIVKLNNKWIILDATWAAGYIYNGKWKKDFDDYYYDIPKEKIFKTHLPEDAVWVLRFGRITKEEFYFQPIYKRGILKSNVELLKPNNGIIYAKSSEDIVLKFKNLDSKIKLFYMIDGEKYAKTPQVKISNNITTVIIKNPNRDTNLNFYSSNTKKNKGNYLFENMIHFKINIL